ncbi:MAG TPA: DNA-primase RepB domain-containing protein [Candidatus Acidoferrum sp.]|nr:DNA-primase RepB domain-containing protein [Candidatus Acidoferrum sp.]
MNSQSPFTPKSLTSSEYVLTLFGPSDNVAILVRNRRLGHTLQRITKAEIIAAPEFQSALLEQNQAGADIFIGMNPVKDGAYARTKQNLKEIRHVYLDLDRNGDRTLQVIRSSPEVPPPNFVLNTSPGKHQVVWRIEGLTLEQAEAFLHSVANYFGGDLAATDATRVLRLPGFANRKLAQEFVVQVLQQTDKVYSHRDFNVPEESPEAPRYLGDGHGSPRPAGHRSQSERDWAYAKRALARGDNPETVIQRIADFRWDDKADPIYYARLTVTNAQAALEERGNSVDRGEATSHSNPRELT